MGDLQKIDNMCEAARGYGLATQLNLIIALLNELRTDAATNRTELLALSTDIDMLRPSITTITAKLDLDAGVTDTDYAATADPPPNSSGFPAATTTAAAVSTIT